MSLRHLAHDGQPEPRARHAARGRSPPESVEDVRQIGGVDARPMVAYGELVVSDAHLHQAALRAPLARIVEKVGDGAVEPPRLTENDGLGEVGVEANRWPVRGRSLDRLGNDPVETYLFTLFGALVAAGQVDQVPDQAGELFDLRDDVLEQPVAVGSLEVRGALQYLDVRAKARKRGAELVGGVGDELALH